MTRPSYITAMRSLISMISSRSSEIISTAHPWSRFSRMVVLTSWAAFTSSPRVGWAATRARSAARASRRATKRCWLPPESWPAVANTDRVWTRASSTRRLAKAITLARSRLMPRENSPVQ